MIVVQESHVKTIPGGCLCVRVQESSVQTIPGVFMCLVQESCVKTINPGVYVLEFKNIVLKPFPGCLCWSSRI